MSPLFTPNIGTAGRLARGLVGLALLVGGTVSFSVSLWLGIALAAAGAFGLFEAIRGWCALRACGIKTRL